MSLSEAERRATWESYKAFLYVLRILRELEPAILIAISLFAYTNSLWMARHGSSYVIETMLPMRSALLDKSAWHFAIMNGETDIETGNAWWQEVDALDVYPSGAVYPGLAEWPQPKAQWADAADDDLWCISYSAAFATHVDYGPIRQPNGTCGSLPARVSSWCDGWRLSVDVGSGDMFPTDDPGWRCLVADDWPATTKGRCYSMCLDISAEKPHAPPKISVDFIVLLLMPVIFDLYFLLTWIHQKALFKGFEGKVKIVPKVTLALIALVFLFTGVMLAAFTNNYVGKHTPDNYPGAICAELVLLLWGFYFFCLAAEDDFPFVKKKLTLWMRLQMWMIGVKSIDAAGSQHPIDSDTALCFFLADGYKSRFNGFKRAALAVLLLIVLVVITFDNSGWAAEFAKYNQEFFEPGAFLTTQYIVLILLIVKISQALKAPQVGVDYNICRETRALDPEPTLKSELLNLADGASAVVMKEACHFVGDFEVGGGSDHGNRAAGRSLTIRKGRQAIAI